MKRITAVAVWVLGMVFFTAAVSTAPAQTSNDEYLQAAKESFVQGKYTDAQQYFKTYRALTGNSDPDFQNKISMCIYCLEKAEKEKAAGNDDYAIDYYKQILDYNPDDAHAKQEIELLEIARRGGAEVVPATANSSAGERESAAVMYSIGDNFCVTEWDCYKICYLDKTMQHGWYMDIQEGVGYAGFGTKPLQHGWRVPNSDEIQVIYGSRKELGLTGHYWTCTPAGYSGSVASYFTLDFSAGQFPEVSETDTLSCIYIREF